MTKSRKYISDIHGILQISESLFGHFRVFANRLLSEYGAISIQDRRLHETRKLLDFEY